MPRCWTFATDFQAILFGTACVLQGLAKVGAAHTPSPDVRYGHPALRSLDAGCAFGILPSLAANAGSQGMGSPSRMLQTSHASTVVRKRGAEATGQGERQANLRYRFSSA
jgi:hypothetical protein